LPERLIGREYTIMTEQRCGNQKQMFYAFNLDNRAPPALACNK
jgi:hypothetical protein